MSKMGSHHPFGHLKHKLWPKEGPWIKLAVWLLTTKSRESTQFLCVQVACDIPLINKGYNFASDLILIEGLSQSYGLQSCGSTNFCNFGIPSWESRDKKPFGCGPRGEVQNMLQGGRWWLPPSLGRGESCESELPVVRPSIKNAPIMH